MEAIANNNNKVVQPLHRPSVQETLLDTHHPQSQEEVHCLGLTHRAQGLNLMALYQLSVALNTHIHAALASGSLGIISGTLNAESLHPGYSVRVEMEFKISDDVNYELLGILFDRDDRALPVDSNHY